MRYFHRTSLPPDDVLAQADQYIGGRASATKTGDRSREFAVAAGKISLIVEAEGGHYTLVNVATDQVGESEIDKLAKAFLTSVHKRVHPAHVARGSY